MSQMAARSVSGKTSNIRAMPTPRRRPTTPAFECHVNPPATTASRAGIRHSDLGPALAARLVGAQRQLERAQPHLAADERVHARLDRGDEGLRLGAVHVDALVVQLPADVAVVARLGGIVAADRLRQKRRTLPPAS